MCTSLLEISWVVVRTKLFWDTAAEKCFSFVAKFLAAEAVKCLYIYYLLITDAIHLVQRIFYWQTSKISCC